MPKSVSLPVAAIVTSRVRRLVEPDEPWLSGMRAAVRRIAELGAQLALAKQTAAADFLRRTAARLNVPVRDVDEKPVDAVATDVQGIDRAVVDAADVVYVLQCRPNGNIHRVLRERIHQGRGGIILVDLNNLQPASIRDELQLAGAQLWQPRDDLCRPLPGGTVAAENTIDRALSSDETYSVVPFPSADGWSFLSHTTRACAGPWPDESMDGYVDAVMEHRPDADHSALSALCRIIRQQRLIGSQRTIRGGHRVVSFTACPLEHLPQLHRFRRHRVRWDFEPYGLCVRRDWLISRAAKPVRYGDDDLWKSLSEEEQPYFQISTGDSGIDWSIEQEWRVLGDLSLAGLTNHDVILFVPDSQSAKVLARQTSFPITLWPCFSTDF